MSEHLAESWSPRRWGVIIGGVFCAQVGLILWLSDRRPSPPPPLRNVPHMQVAGQVSQEWVELTDPTLFALPHVHGFSGPAWLEFPHVGLPRTEWTEAVDAVPLATRSADLSLSTYMRTNLFPSAELSAKPVPAMTMPPQPPLLELPTQSTLRLTGGLAARQLLTPLRLPPQPPRTNNGELDILTNSVVQVLVDAEGKPISIALLGSSGSPEADHFALEQSRAARFAPAREAQEGVSLAGASGPLVRLSLGQIVFEWYTLPSASVGPTVERRGKEQD